jgi:short-subunit dehydrogenase
MTTNSRPLTLITGGSSGIGLELAKCFARDEYDLILVAENGRELDAAAQQLRQLAAIDVQVIEADLSKLDSADSVYERVHMMGRPLDVLVNNAGVGVYGDFTRETDLNEEISMIQLNTIAYVQLTKLFAPAMVARGSGKILMTASVASVTPMPLLAVYGATKAFVLAFAEGLREELRETGVTVTALMPGPTDTKFFERAHASDSKIVDQAIDPAEVAKAGYAALMKGDDKVVVPFKYKVQTAINQVVPDPIVAKNAHKQHERKDEADRDLRSEDRA